MKIELSDIENSQCHAANSISTIMTNVGTPFEERGELKRNRTYVLLASLTSYRWSNLAHYVLERLPWPVGDGVHSVVTAAAWECPVTALARSPWPTDEGAHTA